MRYTAGDTNGGGSRGGGRFNVWRSINVGRATATGAHMSKENVVPVVRKPIGKEPENVIVEELQTLDAVHRSDERIDFAAVIWDMMA